MKSWDIFKRMLALVTPYPGRVAWIVIVGLIFGVFNTSFAHIVKLVTHVLTVGIPPSWVPLELGREVVGVLGYPRDNYDAHIYLAVVLLIGLVLLGLKCFTQYWRRYMRAWLSQRVVNDAQIAVAAHLLTLDLGYFQRVRAGELLSRQTNDMRMLSVTVNLFAQLITGPLTLITGASYAFWVNWRLALLSLIAAPIGAVLVQSLYKKMRAAAKRAQEKMADATSVLTEFLSGIRTVKAFGCEGVERKRFEKDMKELFSVSMKRSRARARVRPIVEFVSGIGMLIVLAIGGAWVLDKKFTTDELMAFLAALALMYGPAKEASDANGEAMETLPAAERVFELLQTKPELTDSPDAHDITAFKQGINVENITFGYDPAKPVLSGIDLAIPAGSCIALVGPSGAGKSTIADLVARFHDPQQGRITIDGTDLKQVTRKSLLNMVAIVSQDPFLFHASIRDNIAYGKLDATDDEIMAAARAANIHEDILAMTGGYNHIVGERGGMLSGGQRQRICIARAIVRNAPIIILDEATSSLDAESERLVQDALERLMSNRTSIVIAHRLSTIRHADLVAVLEDGSITARGKHEELLDSSPTYSRLWKLSSGQEPDKRKDEPIKLDMPTGTLRLRRGETTIL